MSSASRGGAQVGELRITNGLVRTMSVHRPTKINLSQVALTALRVVLWDNE
jgi:hypothetical protein